MGQFSKSVNPLGFKTLNGIARQIHTTGKYDTQILEGQFCHGRLNGYGRICYGTGNYYIGQFKNGKKHGYGKSVLKSGKII